MKLLLEPIVFLFLITDVCWEKYPQFGVPRWLRQLNIRLLIA